MEPHKGFTLISWRQRLNISHPPTTLVTQDYKVLVVGVYLGRCITWARCITWLAFYSTSYSSFPLQSELLRGINIHSNYHVNQEIVNCPARKAQDDDEIRFFDRLYNRDKDLRWSICKTGSRDLFDADPIHII